MTFTKLNIEGLVVIEPKVFGDDRGFFMESYNKKLFKENGIDIDFIQDNHSRSTKNVLRGLHFQLPPFAQDKLVRVIKGEVLDVAVDIRKNSPTYGKWESVRLSEENKKMFLVPQGFAHGFLVLSDSADFEYKVSNYYSPEHDRGVKWDDTDLAIDWGVNSPSLSEKDSKQPNFKDLNDTF